MSAESIDVDIRLREDLEALDRLCVYITREARVLEVAEAEELSAAVSNRIRELLAALIRH